MEKTINAITRWMSHAKFGAGLIAVLLIGTGMLIDRHPELLMSVIAATAASPNGLQIFWTGCNLFVLILVALWVRQQIENVAGDLLNAQTERDLCRSEQSAMRTAISSFILLLPAAKNKIGREIIEKLDAAIESARTNFVPRSANGRPVPGGRRLTDPAPEQT